MSSTHSETRERILLATWKLMEQSRGQGVRLEDVAREARVSRQAVYLHFHSRTDLLIATARYLDERLELPRRIQQACQTSNGVLGIEAYVAFWAAYVPEIYGLGKALLMARETDEAAAAAWADRMGALYEGCLFVVQTLASQGTLDPAWTIEAAADFFWTALSVSTWETLTRERGWSQDQYRARMQWVIKRALLREP
ncbi:TetR/AcrR family transcriptional regulator [Ktedonobacter robiniae]|uniref:TetR family transcriptional regulator n=1 Tax=Ktedonobacter robiniae TaxID=2778365 RepID=A0ABQ3UXH9_9CHLR|nr:TetR/AcrR family transcriptional regulator [Ktedonobacter robiniae]GHO57576.1 TetR family transcriptional regulator [Ktedonobacter robiniae]